MSPEHQSDDPVATCIPDPDEEFFGYEPLAPELVAETAGLLDDVKDTASWTLETFLHRARLFEDISSEVENVFDRADNYGERIDPDLVEDMLETLDAIAERLFAAEQDDALREETFAYARSEYPSEPGDDEIVTVGVRVDPISFGRPRAHVLPMMLRQLNGRHFDGGYRIMTMPRWLHRRIDLHSEHTRIWIVELLEGVPTGEMLEVANSLWDPRSQGAYRSPAAVLEAARLLES